jgi:dihydrofolate reductase
LKTMQKGSFRPKEPRSFTARLREQVDHNRHAARPRPAGNLGYVEAGSKLNGSLIRAGLVDEFLLYLAPKLLGPGPGHGGARSLQSLADAVSLRFISLTRR